MTFDVEHVRNDKGAEKVAFLREASRKKVECHVGKEILSGHDICRFACVLEIFFFSATAPSLIS